jgi:hypothetical protein
MKRLLLLIPLAANAKVISWKNDPSAQGFRVYYREVAEEVECYDSIKEDFVNHKDVGDQTTFSIGEEFKPGRMYEIRVSAYTIGYESKLSLERICTRIAKLDDTEEQTKEDLSWKKPKEAKRQFTEPEVFVSHPVSDKKDPEPPKEKEKEHAPEAPKDPQQVVQFSDDSIPIDDADYDDEPSVRSDSDRDVEPYTGPRSEPTPNAEHRVQPVFWFNWDTLEREDRLRKRAARRAEQGPRVLLFKEINEPSLAGGSNLLRRTDSIQGSGRDQVRVGSKQSRLYGNESRTSRYSYWLKALFALSLLVAAISFCFSRDFFGEE